jgi:phytanoyl-CoA hydroxylase
MENQEIINYSGLFNKNGYVIIKGLIPINIINNVLVELDKAKKTNKIYYTQNTHRCSIFRKTLTSQGFLTNSIQSPSRQIFIGNLRTAVVDVICSEYISQALTELSGQNGCWVSWQDMLFDMSTGTIDHQDHWYLDTDPIGGMIAAWISLEKIDEDSGPFHVYQGSHNMEPLSRKEFITQEDFRIATIQKLNKTAHRKVVALLEPGDVLFWKSLTIHGSSEQKNPTKSRKSLTAHYYPLGTARAGFNSQAQIRLDITNARKTHNKNIVFANTGSDSIYKFNIHILTRYLKDLITKRNDPINGMNRALYSKDQ